MKDLKDFIVSSTGIAFYLVAIILLSLYFTYKLWPYEPGSNQTVALKDSVFIAAGPDSILSVNGEFSPPISYLLQDTVRLNINVTRQDSLVLSALEEYAPEKYPIGELNLLLLILLLGALGSSLHGIASISKFVGNNTYKESWALWYLLRPFVGAILSFLFYLLIRAGLFKNFETNSDFYTIIALSGLIGLFSKQALDKLSDLFDLIFKSDKEKDLSDKMKAAPIPNITDITFVLTGKDNAEIAFTITGSDFTDNSVVRINNKDYKPKYENANQIFLKLIKEDIKDIKTLLIAVFNPPPGGGISNTKEIQAEQILKT
ncbi:MAG: hypothetical protein JXJ22_13105 [Bacteroidales bacterium]|nr:hypothetical protein [Bacteroidales bacterium]